MEGDFKTVVENLNYVWILVCAGLVFFMQAGFMCVESGLARAKNSINVAIKNLADFVIASILFWFIGFGLMFGKSWHGIVGTTDFMLDVSDPWKIAFMTFQIVFVGTAATIDSGAVAERTKFMTYLILSGLISTIVYPVFGHWAWGSLLNNDQCGWLENMGFKDFAGSTVVHSVGGWVALAGVIIIGPRLDKFDEHGKPRKLHPHNMPLVYLGTFILIFGWFGFNCGSTLAATPDIAPIAFNTILSGSFACLVASILSTICSSCKRPEGEMIANGVLGGLVGITAGCAFVDSVGAMFIGIGSGFVVFFATHFIEKVLKLDDVVGAIAVHGFCGAWGTLAVGLFITDAHLGDTTRLHQIGVQALGVATAFVWTFSCSFIMIKTISGFSGGMRVSREDEVLGLNVAEHGASSSILELANAMEYATRTGDFSDKVKITVETGTEAGDLASGFNKMVDTVRTALETTRQQIEAVSNAQAQARKMHDQIEVNQKDYSLKIAKIAEGLDSMVSELDSSMIVISQSADVVGGNALGLQEQIDSVHKSLKKIDEIASTINLISLNAMVEAARAGESGRSFAVVATNMKKLALSSNTITSEIHSVADSIFNKLNDVIGSIKHQIEIAGQGKAAISNANNLIKDLVS